MADYYEEMGWQPIESENIDSHQTLLFARFLRENGIFGPNFNADQLSPPASKEFVKNLKEKKMTSDDEDCRICLKPNKNKDESKEDDADESETLDELFKILPCTHAFHLSCISPWLEKTNTCPLCRHELPTDDPEYESMKKHRSRERQREEELETLHNSMFG